MREFLSGSTQEHPEDSTVESMEELPKNRRIFSQKNIRVTPLENLQKKIKREILGLCWRRILHGFHKRIAGSFRKIIPGQLYRRIVVGLFSRYLGDFNKIILGRFHNSWRIPKKPGWSADRLSPANRWCIQLCLPHAIKPASSAN